MSDTSEIGASDLTRMAVLALLGRSGPASRATIARELDLSGGTVSHVARLLIQQGIVEPLYFAPSEGGRPGQLLGLVSNAGRAIGVKLAVDHIVLVNVHLDGQVVASKTEKFDAMAPNATARLLGNLKSFLRKDNSRLLGIGVCVPGVVGRPDVGDVDADVLCWSKMPLGSQLRREMGVPVLIENDVKALAVAESLYGQGRTLKSFVVLTIGRGVGFACVTNGVLQRGADGGAGEIAHVIVSSNGPQCACGQRGCLESFVGADGLTRAGQAGGGVKSGPGRRRTRHAGRRWQHPRP